MPDPGQCRSCGASIVWVTMKSGKKAPLDSKPEKRVVLHPTTGKGHVVDAYVSHFVTCPDRDQHRRER